MFPTPAHPKAPKKGGRGYVGGTLRQGGKTPKAWKRVKEAFGARKVWWHLLRHTAATSLLCGWWGRRWSLDEVAKMLGHSSVKVTERYAHLLDSELSKIAAETHAWWLARRSDGGGSSSSSGAPPTTGGSPPTGGAAPPSTPPQSTAGPSDLFHDFRLVSKICG
jgi:hypothetical protein